MHASTNGFCCTKRHLEGANGKFCRDQSSVYYMNASASLREHLHAFPEINVRLDRSAGSADNVESLKVTVVLDAWSS